MPAQKALATKRKHEDETLVTSALQEIDWDFSDRKSHSAIEGIHPYPAKFIAQIPRSLLSVLPVRKDTVVFDPYCGSGSTIVESQRLGLHSVGVDLNPIACLMTRVKTSAVPMHIRSALAHVLQEAQSNLDPAIPTIPNLDHWFTGPTQRTLASLISSISLVEPQHHDLLRLALSSIVVRVSNQDSDTRYAAVEKNVTERDVYLLFQRNALRIIETLEQRSYGLVPPQIIEGDTTRLDASQITEKVSIVITSPPYPNAYEYWLYHKYRMWWLGYDPIAVKEREIGARAHFFKTKHHTAQNFQEQMASTFSLLANVMRPDGYACFVVGRSKIHGAIVDNASIIESAGENAGFRRVFSTERLLSPHRKSFNLSHAMIKTETVLVLRFG